MRRTADEITVPFGPLLTIDHSVPRRGGESGRVGGGGGIQMANKLNLRKEKSAQVLAPIPNLWTLWRLVNQNLMGCLLGILFYQVGWVFQNFLLTIRR